MWVAGSMGDMRKMMEERVVEVFQSEGFVGSR
jgi:hypothetical protein